jgi:hypothetical protein
LPGVGINQHRLIWCLWAHINDSGHKHCLVNVVDAKPDRVGLTGSTRIANVDVIIPGSQINACQRAQGYILASGVVIEKSTGTKGGVVAATGVVLHRAITKG